MASCSFDNKTGIWAEDSKKRKRISKQEQQKSKSEVINIYSSKDYFLKEIPPTKNVNLTKAKKNSSWKMSGLNLQNFFGNIYLFSCLGGLAIIYLDP